MKTFESEFQELTNWDDREREKLRKEAEEKYGISRDGVPPEKLNAIRNEFWVKVSELRKKYGLPPMRTQNESKSYNPDRKVIQPNKIDYISGK